MSLEETVEQLIDYVKKVAVLHNTRRKCEYSVDDYSSSTLKFSDNRSRLHWICKENTKCVVGINMRA